MTLTCRPQNPLSAREMIACLLLNKISFYYEIISKELAYHLSRMLPVTTVIQANESFIKKLHMHVHPNTLSHTQ